MRFFLVTDNMHNSACYRPSLEARQSQSCIFLHALAIEPKAIQSALDRVVWARRILSILARLAAGKRSAKPSPAAGERRARRPSIAASASLHSRAAALAFCIRNFRLALAT